MDNFLKNIENGIGGAVNGVSNFIGNEVNQFSPAVQNFAKQAQQALIKLPQNNLVGLNNPVAPNPMNNLMAKTPQFINEHITQPINNTIQGGEDFLTKNTPAPVSGPLNFGLNALQGVNNVGSGLISLPGVLTELQQNPIGMGGQIFNSLLNSYKSDLGWDQNNQWSLKNIGSNFYKRPIETVTDFAPIIGLLGKGAELGKAGQLGEAGDVAKTGTLSPATVLEKGSDILSPEGQTSLFSKINQAKTNQPVFHNLLDSVAQLNDGRTLSNVKDPLAATQKIVENRVGGKPDYGVNNVNDFLRGSVVVNSPEQIAKAITDLKSEVQQRGYNIIGENNYFAKPQKGLEGYHLEIQMPDGQTAEVQIHTPETLAKSQLGANAPTGNNADVASRAYEQQKISQGQYISPMSTDYTGNTGNQVLATDLTKTNQAPSTMLNQPEAVATKDQVLRAQAEQSPQLKGLLQAKDNLTAQLQTPPANPEVDGLVKAKTSIQQELNQVKAMIKTTPSGDSLVALKTRSGELETSLKNIDSQVADMKGKLGVKVDQTNDAIKAQIKDLDKQIEEESTKVKIGEQAKQNPNFNPETGLRDKYNFVNEQMQADLNRAWSPQEFGVKYKGELGANKSLGEVVNDQINKDLSKADQEKVWEALSDPKVAETLTTPQQEALMQVKGLLDTAKNIREQYDPNFKAQENYGPMYVQGFDKTIDAGTKKYLSTFSPESMHREIRSFDPVNGGKTLTGRAENLGLKPTQTGNTFEDAQGNQYLVRAATPKEGESIGLKYNKDLGSVMEQYVNSTLKLKTNSEVLNALKSGEYGPLVSSNRVPGYKQINAPGLQGFWLDPKLADAIENANYTGSTNPLLKGWDATTGAIRSTIFYNALIHPLNMYTNALIGAAQDGLTGVYRLNANLQDAAKAVSEKNIDYINAQREGAGLGGFGKAFNGPGIFETAANKIFDSKTMSQVGEKMDSINPIRQLYQRNKAFVGYADDVLRTSLQKSLEQGGKAPAEAAAEVQKFLVNYNDLSKFERSVVSRFTIFYPWLKGEVKALGVMGRDPVTYAGSIAMTAGLYAASSALQAAFQEWTGNPDARTHFFGLPGLVRDIAEAPGQIMQHQIPTIAGAHINPVVSEGAAQLTNTAYFPDIFNPDKQLLVKPGSDNQLQQRAGHLLNIAGPEKPIAAGFAGKKSVPEIALNLGAMASIPHLAGFQGAPSVPFLNTPGAKPGTGMGIIKAIDQSNATLSDQDKAQLATIKSLQANYSPDNQRTINDMYAANPKLWEAKAITEKASAQANGTPVNPLYATDKNTAQAYYKYQNMSSAQQAAYSAKDQSIIGLDRKIDTYKQDPKVQKAAQDAAKAGGYQYLPYIANPLYANDPKTNQPKYSDQTIAAYRVYQNMPSATLADSSAKAAYMGNHPQIMLAQIDSQNYSLQRLQQAWDNRPAGQTAQQFAATQNSSVFGGIDAKGKVIPAYNLLDEPKYQLMAVNHQAGAIFAIYKGAMANRNYSIADGLAAKYPWISTIDAAQKAYNQAHPFNSESNNELGGLGIDFSSTGSGSGGSGSSGGSGGLASEMKYMLYHLAPSFASTPKADLTPFGTKSGSKGTGTSADPLKAYFAEQQQVSKLLAAMPQISTKDLPQLKLAKLNVGSNDFSPKPLLPKDANQQVQAGRLMTKLQ